VFQSLLSFKVTGATITPNNAQINTLQINDQTLNMHKTTTYNTNTTKNKLNTAQSKKTVLLPSDKKIINN
jgi:hypothetical protein